MTMNITIDLSEYRRVPFVAKNDEIRVPRILTMAGSDSSGGAGIEADLKTITSHRCYGMTCINSLTAQNTEGVQDAYELPIEFITKILDSNFQDITPDVIKTGMIGNNGVQALLLCVEKYQFKGKLVIDPVMVSTSGFELAKVETLKFAISNLFPMASLVTPNMVEARTILALIDGDFEDEKSLLEYYTKLEITTPDQLTALCRKIVEKTSLKSVLIKGGHLRMGEDGHELIDTLYEAKSDTVTFFKSKFQESSNTHGTGCTLLSSILSNLGKGMNLRDAVGNGIIYVQLGIENLDHTIGHGHGPLNHFELHEPISFGSEQYTVSNTNLMDFLKSHPSIAPSWEQYTKHTFVSDLAAMKLPMDKFYDFLKQDHAYLMEYGKTHCFAAALAPNVDEFLKEVAIMQNVIQEMLKHKNKLLNLGIKDDELNTIELNPLGKKYRDFLLGVAKHGTWLEINLAMAACLFGYREAAIYGKSLLIAPPSEKTSSDQQLQYRLYKEWLDDYTAEWYHELCINGAKVIENCDDIASYEIPNLIKIFKTAVDLEIAFWNEFL